MTSRENRPFQKLYRQLLADGVGRRRWVEKARKTGREFEEGYPWRHKEIWEAGPFEDRTEQLWRAGHNEPSERHLSRLLDIFYENTPSNKKKRAAFIAAAVKQKDIRNAEKRVNARWDVSVKGSPYRGLLALTESETDIFFGQDDHIAALAKKLAENDFVAVVGASGSGKSSLVWAGLIPHLTQRIDHGHKVDWKWVRFQPGIGREPDPIRALAEALTRNPPGLISGIDFFEVENRLLSGDASISKLMQSIVCEDSSNNLVLLFIDQFEELFTSSIAQAKQKLFQEILSRLLETRRVKIIATLRAEFLGHCTSSESFGEQFAKWLTHGNHWLAPPSEGRLFEMIKGPANRAGLKFEDGLIETIVAETGAKPGNLPLMAFALERLFQSGIQNRLLTWEAYKQFGGVSGAIRDIVGKVFADIEKVHGPQAERSLLCLFRLLIEVDEETETVTRRITKLHEIPSDLTMLAIIDNFVDKRLLVRNADKSCEATTLEVSHEALFNSWPRLSDWIASNKEHFVTKRRLIRSANDWNKFGRPDNLRWSDQIAIDAMRSITALEYDMTPNERAFLGPCDLREMLSIIDDAHTQSTQRAVIGIRLDLVGDSRPGVGVIDNLPDIVWCFVPLERIHRQPNELNSARFQISKYPITQSQYKLFVEDKNGYWNDIWWKGLPQPKLKKPGLQQPPHGNHPAVNVTWTEAMAYCRWLSQKMGKKISLPTEKQWEMAANSANSAFQYPWGEQYISGYANINEIWHGFGEYNLRKVVACGLYPQAVSHQGVADLIGNIWEWCDTDVPNATGPVWHVVCGGSCLRSQGNSSPLYRDNFDPNYSSDTLGFRICLSDEPD